MAIINTVTASVGTTATKIHSKRAYRTTDRARVLVHNSHATAAMFIGPADVTATSGVKLAAGERLALDLSANDDLYAVVATGTGSAVVMKH